MANDPLPDPLPDPPDMGKVACIGCRSEMVVTYIHERVKLINARPDVDGDNARAALTITAGMAAGLILKVVEGPRWFCPTHVRMHEGD